MAAPTIVLPVADAHIEGVIPTESWLEPTVADGEDNGWLNTWPIWLDVANDGPIDITVTVKGVRPCSQNVIHDVPYLVPASGKLRVGPFDRHHYNDLEGYVRFTVGPNSASPSDIGVVAVRQI